MAERNWTEAQKAAIELEGHSLLVSAAAGSGKTAVLTERIIRRITAKENPLDITRCAIVTFTRAAASELKERLAKALSSACAAEPKNKRLSNQLVKLSSAKIGTIHSFCFDIIRSNFSALGLRSGVRIAEEAEIRLRKKDIMNRIIDGFYDAVQDNSSIANFGDFVDIFVGDRDDRLADILIGIYDKLMTVPDGLLMLEKQRTSLEAADGLPTDGWGKVIRSMVSSELEYYSRIFAMAADCMTDGGKLEKNYLPSFEYDRSYCVTLCGILKNGTYDEIRQVLSEYSPITLGRGVKTAEQTGEILLYKKHRTDFSARLKSLRTRYFTMTSEQLEDSKRRTSQVTSDILTLLREFDAALTKEKQRLGILDFSDLEILTYRLLYNEDGSITPTAHTVSESYDEIYIDEYQDTNELQDSIFRAISKPDNRFMVGDIKQSIYGFRGAAPGLFAGYRGEFAPYSNAEPVPEDAPGLTVYLSNNFRSDKPIIDFANVIFGCLFTNAGGNIPYSKEDALICSKTDRPEYPVEIALIESSDDEDESGDITLEAEYVAEQISKLLDEGVKPGEIAILFRSAKKSAKPFEAALEKLNVPYYNDVTKSFFENPEILLAMCLLNTIDNPTRDIYLAGTLRSPLFGFTLDELARIRLKFPDSPSLYESLKDYTAENSFEKADHFFEKLNEWRSFAASKPVDKLIWHLWQDTGMTGIGSGLARKNLMLLYDYARRFEGGSFKGLYNFILYINDILSERETLENAKEFSESDDTIKLTTIHRSKGLEYRVVFVCGTSGGFNKTDLNEPILFESSLGAAVRLRDETGFARFTTPMRQALALKLAENTIEEEMRVLYVALTRPKERLYITAEVKNAAEVLDDAENSAMFLSEYSLSKGANYLSWILTALKASPEYNAYNLSIYTNGDITSPGRRVVEADKDNTAIPGNELTADEYRRLVFERFDYEYPYRRLTGLPAKLTVSKLHPGVLDEDDTSADIEDSSGHMPEIRIPRFLEGEQPATGAMRGTATHTFMQFCDFDYVEKYGIKEELERLVTDEYITRASADLVNIWMLERFFKSKLYRDIRQAKQVWREVRFNIKYPASDFTNDSEAIAGLRDEYILVQGVIDCFYTTDDGRLILVDYKTDYIPQELRETPGAPEAMLLERHSRQLGYYKEAVQQLTGMKVDRTVLYSFSLAKDITVD